MALAQTFEFWLSQQAPKTY